MADLNDRTQNVNIWNDEKTKSVTVTTDGAKERLDVDSKPSSIFRVATPVFENGGHGNGQTRISYTVPTGKVLYIQRLWCCHHSDAAGHTIVFRVDGTGFCWMEFNNDGTTSFEKTYPESNPYIVNAGEEVTAYRESGSSPEDWSPGFDGYLEDA